MQRWIAETVWVCYHEQTSDVSENSRRALCFGFTIIFGETVVAVLPRIVLCAAVSVHSVSIDASVACYDRNQEHRLS